MMMLRLRGFAAVFLVLLLCAAAGPVHAHELQALLDDLRSLRAEFTQRLFDEAGQLVEESRGLFYLQRPERFRWEYKEPYAQLIVADGKEIWIYEADLEQATLKDYSRATANTPALVLSGRQPVAELFEVTAEHGEEDGVAAYLLRPKGDDSQFQHMRLYFLDGVLQRLNLQDKLGQKTEVRFYGARLNSDLDAELFRFTLPPEADLIDGRN